MDSEMDGARKIAIDAIKSIEIGRPWAFECSPASSESADVSYLRKVQEADFVVWLVGRESTPPVVNEVNEAIASGRRLLVFKLPADQRDDSTLNLIEMVRNYAKWQVVNGVEELPEQIKASIADEIIRGLRDPMPPSRGSKLSQDLRLSVSRCKNNLVSLGVDEHTALEMAEENQLGDVLPTFSPGMYTIVDAQGSGKTLAVERLFQRAVRGAIEDSSQPYPLFVDARELNESVRDYIEKSLQGKADPSDPRVLLIIDGVDEMGSRRALDTYNQARVYTDANQRATVILTTKAIPSLKSIGEGIRLNRLTEEESTDLITRVSGHDLNWRHTYRWPESIRDAVRLPLFAVMIGSLLRDDPRITFATPGQVIAQLANKALEQAPGNIEELDRLLQELAVKSTDEGGRVLLSAITPVLAKQRLLRDSRLIEQTSDAVDFALPIFREWYAARALIEGTISVDRFQQTSDRWLPSLSIALSSEHDDLRNSLMNHLISTDPGLASLLLEEYNQSFSGEEGEILNLGTAKAAGTKIREAMVRWKAGLGDLFAEVGPISREGAVATLGVNLSNHFLTTAWYAGESDLPAVVDFEDIGGILRASPEWPRVSSSSLSSRIRDPFWWSYVETHERLSQSLSEALHGFSLTICSRDACHELSWDFISGVLGRSRLGSDAFELEESLATIEAILKRNQSFGLNQAIYVVGSRHFEAKELKAVAEYLKELADQGAKEIQEPWPSSDLPFSPGYVWNNYSDHRLLERTISVYSRALRIYGAIVDRWFSCFATRLPFYGLLPVRLEGWLTTSRQLASPRDWPSLEWYCRILPPDQDSEVEFQLAPKKELPIESESSSQQEQQAFVIHRPNLISDISPAWRMSSLGNVFGFRPATELALDWLRGDLQELGWELSP